MLTKNKKKRMKKVAVVCAHGGHLEQAQVVLEAFKDCEVFLITYDFATLKDFQHPYIKKIYCIKFFGDSFMQIAWTMLFTCFSCIRIFLKERPRVIFSTGAEIAIPAFYIGKFLFRTKVVFLETILRRYNPTRTARLAYCVSDLFLVQWESLLPKFGKKAKYEGKIL